MRCISLHLHLHLYLHLPVPPCTSLYLPLKQVEGDFGKLEFQPPCLVKYAPNFDAMPFGESLVIATYCVPTRPGWVRPLANVLLDSEAHLVEHGL